MFAKLKFNDCIKTVQLLSLKELHETNLTKEYVQDYFIKTNINNQDYYFNKTFLPGEYKPQKKENIKKNNPFKILSLLINSIVLPSFVSTAILSHKIKNHFIKKEFLNTQIINPHDDNSRHLFVSFLLSCFFSVSCLFFVSNISKFIFFEFCIFAINYWLYKNNMQNNKLMSEYLDIQNYKLQPYEIIEIIKEKHEENNTLEKNNSSSIIEKYF